MEKYKKYTKMACAICCMLILTFSGIRKIGYDKDPSNFDLLVFITCAFAAYDKDE